MYTGCENCANCTEMEDGSFYCETYGTETDRIEYCDGRDEE